jgi:hypothetical protein
MNIFNTSKRVISLCIESIINFVLKNTTVPGKKRKQLLNYF